MSSRPALLPDSLKQKAIKEHLDWVRKHGGSLRAAVASQEGSINEDAPIFAWANRHASLMGGDDSRSREYRTLINRALWRRTPEGLAARSERRKSEKVKRYGK